MSPGVVEREASRPEPALHGDLARFSAADFLQFLGFLGLTGTIEFSRGVGETSEQVRFRVRGGRLIEATGNAPHIRLGELLVRRYDVALESVLDLLRRQVQSRSVRQPISRLGELLMECGQIDSKNLRQALDEAATRVACRVLTWREGRFAYWPENIEEPTGVTASVGLEDLVLERWHATETFS